MRPAFWSLLFALGLVSEGVAQLSVLSYELYGIANAAASEPGVGEEIAPTQEFLLRDNPGSWQTNLTIQAAFGGASAGSSARAAGQIEPFSITATGRVSLTAFTTSNTINSAGTVVDHSLEIVFRVEYAQEYSLETFLDGAGNGAGFNGQITFSRENQPTLLWALPADGGSVTNRGNPAPGFCRLRAALRNECSLRGGEVAAANAVYALRLNLSPIIPVLYINRTEPNVILSWTTNAVGFSLYAKTNLVSTDWQPVPPSPVILGDQYTVTDPASEDQRFYRLVAP